MGASAAVVLATVVNAAVANESVFIPTDAAPVDLSWAVYGGGAPGVQQARVFCAQKAVTRIQALDRLASAPSLQLMTPVAFLARETLACNLDGRRFLPAPQAGPCQPSAP